MKIKQKIITVLLVLAIIVGSDLLLVSVDVYADCAGIKTSLINCNGTSSDVCAKSAGGLVSPTTDPNEGSKPKPGNTKFKDNSGAMVEKSNEELYIATYHHPYGSCENPDSPWDSNNPYVSLNPLPVNPMSARNPDNNAIYGLLKTVITILTYGIGILATAGLIYGAILYASAGGNADQIKKAKEFIKNVIIGLLAYALMYAVLQFIIPGGVIG